MRALTCLLLRAKKKKMLSVFVKQVRMKLVTMNRRVMAQKLLAQRKRISKLRRVVTKNDRKNGRLWWVRPLFQERKTKGAWFVLIPDLRNDPEKFYNYFRMTAQSFDKLLGLLSASLQKYSWREPICPGERLAITLRYYVSGESYMSLSHQFRASDQVISKIVLETSVVIYTVLEPLVFQKPTEEFWLKNAAEYQSLWNFPHCLGAVDGCHVFFKNPAHSGSRYYNFKRKFSIVLMAISDAKRRFISIDVGASGRRGDSDVFLNSSFGKLLQKKQLNIPPPCKFDGIEKDLPFVIIGDGAFERSRNLVNPFCKTKGVLSAPKRVFNTRFSRARQCVEDSFGLLWKRYTVFDTTIEGTQTATRYITMACCALTNFHLMDEESVSPSRIRKHPELYYDRVRDDGTFIKGRFKNEDPEDEKKQMEILKLNVAKVKSVGSNPEDILVGEDIREVLLDYFISHPIPGQWKKACVTK